MRDWNAAWLGLRAGQSLRISQPYWSVMPPEVGPRRDGSRYCVSFDDLLTVRASSRQIWNVLERADQMMDGSRWVDRVEMSTPTLGAGTVITAQISTPLPFRLTVRLAIDVCECERRVIALVGGDLAGRATLELAPSAQGCTCALRWKLEMRHPVMRAMAVLSGPLLRWGHDHVARATIASLIDRTESNLSGGDVAGPGPRGSGV